MLVLQLLLTELCCISMMCGPLNLCKKVLDIDGILPKGPYPPCLRMADRTLSARYPQCTFDISGCNHRSTKFHAEICVMIYCATFPGDLGGEGEAPYNRRLPE